MHKLLFAAAAVASLIWFSNTHAAPFTPGNLAVYRTGDGSSMPTNAPAPVFIDEYTPGGVLVQSISMPTFASGASRALTAQGNASLEGLINLSTDGQYLVFSGYDHNLGDVVPVGPGNGTLAQTSAAQVPRTIGRLDYDGNLDTTTTYNDSGQGSPRSVITHNGTDFYVSQGSIGGGSDGGIRFTTLGANGASTLVSSDTTDTRHIDRFGGQLFASNANLSLPGIVSIDPISGTMTGLEGIPSDVADQNTVQFFMADLSNEVDGLDTIYVADTRNQNNGGGLHKYSLMEGVWNLTGSIAGNQGANQPVSLLRGLTGVVDGSEVTLYGTRNSGAGGQLMRFFDDTGYGGTLSGTATLLATGINVNFKGVDFVPQMAAAVTGDYNGDGEVDAADYVVWRRDDGSPQGYSDWRSNFGSSLPGGGGGASSAVPEPTAWIAALVGLVAISPVARRRRMATAR